MIKLLAILLVLSAPALAETVEGTVTATVVGTSSVMLCSNQSGECHTPLEWINMGVTNLDTLEIEE